MGHSRFCRWYLNYSLSTESIGIFRVGYVRTVALPSSGVSFVGLEIVIPVSRAANPRLSNFQISISFDQVYLLAILWGEILFIRAIGIEWEATKNFTSYS